MTIIYDPKLPKWIVTLHVKFAEWLQATYDIKHSITIKLYNNRSLKTLYKIKCWGYFEPDAQTIGLACRRPPNWPWAIHVLEVFAHEFCHYERYRDGRKQNERGIDKRALAMVRRFMKEVVC
jgi:hypothetical protein